MKILIRWLKDSLVAIEAINNKGIIHNGINPQNIYYSNQKGIIIGDLFKGIFIDSAEKLSLEEYMKIKSSKKPD